MNSGATISKDLKHRYALWRIWNDTLPKVMFIGLNPSRADAKSNDPTITRCMRFAALWGYGGIYFANLFSFRTPYPQVLIENLETASNNVTDVHLVDMIQKSKTIVCCWGSWKFISGRADYVSSLIDEPYCFGINKDGQPKHPLYLHHNTQLKSFVIHETAIQ